MDAEGDVEIEVGDAGGGEMDEDGVFWRWPCGEWVVVVIVLCGLALAIKTG